MNPLVIRIVFHSGRVVEERGSEDMVQLLFEGDELDLVDYVMAIDQRTGEVFAYSDEEDTRFDDILVLHTNEIIKWNRRL